MENEIEQMQENDSQELMLAPKNKKVIGVKWINKLKYNPNRNITNHKAYLISK